MNIVKRILWVLASIWLAKFDAKQCLVNTLGELGRKQAKLIDKAIFEFQTFAVSPAYAGYSERFDDSR